MNNRTLFIEGGLTGNASIEKSKLIPLQNAIALNKMVHIEYHSRDGSISERDIEPHAFLFKDFVWYIYAFCRLRSEFRTFKVNRISKLILLNKSFFRRSGEEVSPWNLISPTTFESVDLLLKVKEEARYDVEEWLGVEALTKSSDSDWPYIASGTVIDDKNLTAKLLSFGGNIKVVAPNEVKQKVFDVAKQIVENI
jgi:predicted DNA-binding transcriptional regulator YafY